MSRDAQDALLSVAQAASLLGVHPNTVRSWTDAGRLTAYRINSRGDRRFRRSEVERILVEDAPAGIEATLGERSARAEELAIFERLATGMATTPSPGGVARALVEALRTEWHADRAAVYIATEGSFELAAHAGFDLPPPSSSPIGDEPMLEFDTYENPFRDEITTARFDPQDGYTAIPTGPGLGIEIDEDAVRRYVIER